MLKSFFLLPYILQPTRITERSATLIDDIFANTYAMNAISGNLVSKISDPRSSSIPDCRQSQSKL